jgi:beta-lactamase superfamily II metal-dependent hydrolase
LSTATRQSPIVFVTHQHYDHFLGLRYLKNNGYSIDYLICSPYKRRYSDNSVEYDEWRTFQEFADYFVDRGTKIYRPYRQTDFGKPWWAPWGLKIWMLGPSKSIASSPTRELHDASLVFHIKMGSRKCLFTGDASDTSLKWIAGHTKNPCGDILHASHHGSINGADLDFIKKCKASYTVISTKAGVHSNVPHPTALARYKNHTSDEVYRTDKDGTLRWTF